MGNFRKTSAALAIINMVPYIVPLELGHSRQAPGGFMRIVMREMRVRGVAKREVSERIEFALTQANRTVRQVNRRRLPG